MKKISISLFQEAKVDPKLSKHGQNLEIKSLEDLHDIIKNYAWSPAVFKSNERKLDNFLYADCIALDFDSNLSVKEAIKRLTQQGFNYSLTYSRNHQLVKHKGKTNEQPACDRFRVILPLIERATNSADFLATLIKAQEIFPELDASCIDAARFFFPSTGHEISRNIENNGKNFTLHKTKLSYEEIKRNSQNEDDSKEWNLVTDHKYGKKPLTESSVEFLNGAHTGFEGTWHNRLLSFSFQSARCGWREEEIKEIVMKYAPDNLSYADLRAIHDGTKRGEEKGIYRNLKMEQVDNPKNTQTIELIKLCLTQISLFKTVENITYAKITNDDGKQRIILVNNRDFKLFVTQIVYTKLKKSLSDAKLKEVIQGLESIALFDSPIEKVFTRVAKYEDCFYIDLANSDGQIIKIEKIGDWSLTNDAGINFYRPQGLLELPTPEKCTDISIIKDLMFSSWNSCDSFFPLILAFMIKSLTYDTGPYPILCVIGLQGSGKSELSSMIKYFIDPNKASLRSPPEKVDDLVLSGKNAHLICIDNISTLSGKLSDAFCSISTGAGYSTRKLYTNDEEFLVNIIKPILMNGITMPTNRPDFLERTLIIDLPKLSNRKTQKEMEKQQKEVESKVMGFLLYLLSNTYKQLDQAEINQLPRMADFAKWGTAMCNVLGFEDGYFMKIYNKNNEELSQSLFDDSQLAIAITTIMENTKEWKGRATDLLSQIMYTDELKHLHSDRSFPKTPEAIGKELRRIIPILEQNNFEVYTEKRREIIILNKNFESQKGKTSANI